MPFFFNALAIIFLGGVLRTIWDKFATVEMKAAFKL